MTNDEAQAAAKQWHGQAGGRLCPQLTENELAGIVNDAMAIEAQRYNSLFSSYHEVCVISAQRGKALDGLLDSDVGKSTLRKLADGQGTDTEDGKLWIRAMVESGRLPDNVGGMRARSDPP